MRTCLFLAILLLGLVGLLPTAWAEDSLFFHRSRDGWFWFKEIVKPALKEKKDLPEKLPPTLKEMRERAEALLALAIEKPEEENILAYMAYQRLLTRRAEDFAGTWQRLLWQHPELDPTVEEPVAAVGLTAARTEQIQERDERLTELAQTSGLIYFYSGNCPLCEIQSPLLAKFQDAYGFRVIPISLDGAQDSLFPQAKIDRGAASRLGVTQVPAIFLARPPSEVLRVGTGLLSLEDLTLRLYRLSEEIKKDEEIFHESIIQVSDHHDGLSSAELTSAGRLTAAAR